MKVLAKDLSQALEIIRAGPERAGRLTQVAHAAKAHWGYPVRWMALWCEELTLTPAFLEAHEVYAATIAGEAVGSYALTATADAQVLELDHCWVSPDAMGRGIGQALLSHAKAEAARRGASRIKILSDPNATGFYQRMGARSAGEQVYLLEGQPRTLPVFLLDVAE